MKIFNLLITLSLMAVLVSCGDDGEPGDPNSGDAQFTGTWKAESFTAQVSSSTSTMGNTIVTEADIDGVNLDYTVVLSESPMTFTTSGSYDIEGDISISGIMQPISDSYDNVSGSGTYRIEGDSLFTVGAFFDVEINGVGTSLEQGETASKITLQDGKMVIEQSTNMTESPLPGISTSTTIISESIWEKQ